MVLHDAEAGGCDTIKESTKQPAGVAHILK